MSKKKQKRQVLKKKLFTKNRLVILNEDTFEEVFSLRLTLMNVFVVASLSTVTIIFVTTYIIAFTPLREYIPGYASTKLKQEATTLALKSDSLTKALQRNDAYIESIKKVLTGKLDFAKFNKDSIMAAPVLDITKLDMEASDAEMELREEIKLEEEKNNPKTKKGRKK